MLFFIVYRRVRLLSRFTRKFSDFGARPEARFQRAGVRVARAVLTVDHPSTSRRGAAAAARERP